MDSNVFDFLVRQINNDNLEIFRDEFDNNKDIEKYDNFNLLDRSYKKHRSKIFRFLYEIRLKCKQLMYPDHTDYYEEILKEQKDNNISRLWK